MKKTVLLAFLFQAVSIQAQIVDLIKSAESSAVSFVKSLPIIKKAKLEKSSYTTGGQTDSCGVSPRLICTMAVIAVTNTGNRQVKIWNKNDSTNVTILEPGNMVHFDSKGYCCDNIFYSCEKTNDTDQGLSTCNATFSFTASSGGGKPDLFGCRDKDSCGSGSAF